MKTLFVITLGTIMAMGSTNIKAAGEAAATGEKPQMAQTMPSAPSKPSPWIQWETTEITVPVDAKATQAAYLFRGKNTGTTPQKILRIEKSCGCQSIEASTMEVAPNEEITIQGKITFPAMRGTQKKLLRLIGQEGQTQELVVTIAAPEGPKLDKNTLTWANADNHTQRVTLTIPPEAKMKLGPIQVLGGVYQVEHSVQGATTQIEVTPTPQSRRAALRIETITEEGDSIPQYVRLEKADAPKEITNNPTQKAPERPQRPLTKEDARKETIRELRELLTQTLVKLNELERTQ
jgi:hypothetical protein